MEGLESIYTNNYAKVFSFIYNISNDRILTHYKTAREAGALEVEIKTAIEIGEMVKNAVAANTRKFAEILVLEPQEVKISGPDPKNPNPC